MNLDKKIYHIKFLDNVNNSHNILVWAKGEEQACENINLRRLGEIDAHKARGAVPSVSQVLTCELLREQSDYTTVTNSNDYIEISYNDKNYFLVENSPVLVVKQ